MKRFEKVTAGFMSLAMLACVGASQAFAAEINKENYIIYTNNGNTTADAKVGLVSDNDPQTIDVRVQWGSLIYNYGKNPKDGTTYWKSASHRTSDTISITNYSSIAIDATCNFEAYNGYDPGSRSYGRITPA